MSYDSLLLFFGRRLTESKYLPLTFAASGEEATNTLASAPLAGVSRTSVANLATAFSMKDICCSSEPCGSDGNRYLPSSVATTPGCTALTVTPEFAIRLSSSYAYTWQTSE